MEEELAKVRKELEEANANFDDLMIQLSDVSMFRSAEGLRQVSLPND